MDPVAQQVCTPKMEAPHGRLRVEVWCVACMCCLLCWHHAGNTACSSPLPISKHRIVLVVSVLQHNCVHAHDCMLAWQDIFIRG